MVGSPLVLALTLPFAIHPERSAQIAEVFAAGSTWVARAHPRFSEEAPGASEYLLGVKSNSTQRIESAIARGLIERYRPQQLRAIPDSWDAAEAFPQCAKVINDIRDQSHCGVCLPKTHEHL